MIPSKAHHSDAGFDLTAVEKYNDEYGNIVYDTKIAVHIPEGYVGLVYPRSSVSRYTHSLANSVGVIDSGYIGSILLKMKPTAYYSWRSENEPYEYEVGDRIGQLVIQEIPQVEFNQVDALAPSARGSHGFGSTNKK